MKKFLSAALLTSAVMVSHGYAMDLEMDEAAPSYASAVQCQETSEEGVNALRRKMLVGHQELTKVYFRSNKQDSDYLKTLDNSVRKEVHNSIDQITKETGINVVGDRAEIDFYNDQIKAYQKTLTNPALGEEEANNTKETVANCEKYVEKLRTPLFSFLEELKSIQNIINELDEESQL